MAALAFPNSPAVNDQYTFAGSTYSWDGTSWRLGNGLVIVSQTAPASPVNGMLWWKSDDGSLKIYYNDGSSQQWVDVVASNPLGGTGRLLSTQTASASATLDFTNFISTAFNLYQFEFDSIVPATATASFQMQMGTGAGPSWDTASNYLYAGFAATSTGASAISSSASATSVLLMSSLDNASTSASLGHLKLYSPSSASLHKRFTFQTFYVQAAQSVGLSGGGAYKSATAVTGVRFAMSSGNIASGSIRLYGVSN